MKTSIKVLFVSVAAILCSAGALGAFSVSPNSNVTWGQNPTTGKWHVDFGTGASGNYSIQATAHETVEYIHSASSSTVIVSTDLNNRPLTVDSIGPSTGTTMLKIGDFIADDDIGTASTGGGVRVAGVSIELKSNGGDLVGPIEVTGPSDANIEKLDFSGGTIRADVSNPYGSIGVITCNAAAGASAQSPITVSCRDYLGEFHVTTDATHVNIADAAAIPSQRTMVVGAVTTGNDFTGDIKAKRIAELATIPSETSVNIGRDYSGTIDFSEGVSFDAHCYPPEYYAGFTGYFPSIRIGRSLVSGSVIQVPAYTPQSENPFVCQTGGVETQVVVNTTNDPNGHIAGDVFVGGTQVGVQQSNSITDGQYQNTPQSLGYGALGLVPFGLHGGESKLWLLKSDDTTLRGPYSERQTDAPNTIFVIPFAGYDEFLGLQVEFFGPVIAPEGGFGSGNEDTDTLILESKPFNLPGDCWDVEPLGFKVFQRNPRHVDFLGAHTYITDTIGAPTAWTPGQNGSPHPFTLGSGKVYRVRVNLDDPPGQSEDHRLYCDVDPAGKSNPLVRQDYFTFIVGCPCPTDLNFNGVTNTSDLTLLLLEFGRTQSSNPVPCPPQLHADIVVNNAVDTADLTALLVAFGSTCPAPPCPGFLTAPRNAEQPASSHGIANSPAGTHAAQQHDGADENGNGAVGNQFNFPPPTGPLLSALGFSTTDQYDAYVNALSPEAQIEHIQFLIALARALGYE